MLDENNIIPLYHQLKELLREKIKGGEWQEGSKVPSERELMEIYQVSRTTVRQALSELLTDGLIYKKQGVGTFISESKIVQDLIGELSFNQQAIRKGLAPSSKVIYQAIEKRYSNRILDIFRFDDQEAIHKIIRVRFANNDPLILETLHIPNKYAPNVQDQDLANVAVFDYLEKECRLEFTHSSLEIEPIAINEFESLHLGVEIGKPALSLERIIYSGDHPIVIQKRIMRGDRGKFSLTLGENPKKKNENEFLAGLKFRE